MKTPGNPNSSGAHTPSTSENNTNDQALPAVFVIMGKTGAGKSSFIKLLGGRNACTEEEPVVDSSTKSCTLESTPYRLTLNNKRIILIDTPGFDDSVRDNFEPLNDIVTNLWYLAMQREKFPLHGIIFLHDISEPKFSGSQRKTFSMLKQICGEKCMGNVVIGTTMWVEESPKKFLVQQKREDEFRRVHWSGICSTRLFEDDYDAAVSIITALLSVPPVLLRVQEEMLRPSSKISDTTVVKKIVSEAREQMKKGDTEEAGFIDNWVERWKNPGNMTFAEKFGLAIAAPIVLAPAALVAAPLGVIYALVDGADRLSGNKK